MLLVADVKRERCLPKQGDERDLPLVEWVNRPRSDLPAITHVDFSARVQTVSEATQPRFHALLSAFETLTGCPVLINTSFNVRGEPIVCTPQDALRCFLGTEMDVLVLENFVIRRAAQTDLPAIDREQYLSTFALD
jgi:carbamoyltransferase